MILGRRDTQEGGKMRFQEELKRQGGGDSVNTVEFENSVPFGH